MAQEHRDPQQTRGNGIRVCIYKYIHIPIHVYIYIHICSYTCYMNIYAGCQEYKPWLAGHLDLFVHPVQLSKHLLQQMRWRLTDDTDGKWVRFWMRLQILESSQQSQYPRQHLIKPPLLYSCLHNAIDPNPLLVSLSSAVCRLLGFCI